MPDLDINDAILTRRYDLSDGGHVDVYVWKPEQGALLYECAYLMQGFGKSKVNRAHGEDPLEAVQHALIFISRSLYASNDYRDGRLTYKGSRDLRLPPDSGQIAGTDDYKPAKLLWIVTDTTVVLMPDTPFPYMAHPGEWCRDYILSLERIANSEAEEAREMLQKLIQDHKGMQEFYEWVCRSQGIPISYFPKEPSAED
ncbi:DUF6968 family protein [Asticcacaulis solisilvae]|uniref:DUF6968 family protein n=1 Tax=Asticcacaulis solisilvae TaxID=1217274 RepID=UPI003FD7D35D